jgi:hypothetical protein
MTNLERTLAGIHESIEHARASKNALALAVLLRRKEVICAVLAAPEHTLHHPDKLAASPAEPCEADDGLLMQLVA